MSEEIDIRVNFGKPIPIFPLESASLLPQQILPLHIFEPRYCQMVEHVLDGPGQIAMAVFRGQRWKQEYHGRPPLRPYVCVGQIIQHERVPNGRYNLLVHGVCRARIEKELPAEEERLYRLALLRPIGVGEHEPELEGVRQRLEDAFSEGPLTRMSAAKPVLEYIRNEQIPTSALLELVSFTMLTDRETRYTLLAEEDAGERARLVELELERLGRLVRRAMAQHPERWPKGVSWN
ncbi:MAG: LON peptidase substrate-binding domain-containing protein [Phycisphaeraceae bacterium]|nr:LON peptidase substrate-binding domain-containing protein [Phycisphaeraceae bacterium]